MSGRLLGRDPVSRTMPWMVAVMAFIAALSLALALAVEAAAARFGSGLSGNVTIEVPHDDAEGAADARAAQIVAGVTKVPGCWPPRSCRAPSPPSWSSLGWAPTWPEAASPGRAAAADAGRRAGRSRQSAPGRHAVGDNGRRIPAIRIDDHRSWLDQLLGWVTAVRLGPARCCSAPCSASS